MNSWILCVCSLPLQNNCPFDFGDETGRRSCFLSQSFSNQALLIAWTGQFFVRGAALYIMGCVTASFASDF